MTGKFRVFVLWLVLFVCARVCVAAPVDPVFDVAALTATPLNAKVLKSEEKDGIVTQEVMFHSETDGEKSVDIFAFFSFPKGARKLPAFIWNQGGLGQANTYWTEFGARRGYATLCIDFPLPGYRSTGAYPINTKPDLAEISAISDPRQAPIYHGAVALLKAVSFLQSRSEVDAERIGMAGSSWGGFFTTLMIGIDPRLKAGSAMFGTGSLQEGNVWWDSNGESALRDAAYREHWAQTLDPAWRLQNTKTPLAWFSGTNDTFYWMPALMKTYAMAAGPKSLTLVPNWDHGLPPIGDEQVFAWLDTHLKGKPAFPVVSPLSVARVGKSVEVTWKFSGPRPMKSAELMLSYGPAGNWARRYWIVKPAKLEGDTCRVVLPPCGTACYVGGAVLDEKGFRYSTPIQLIEAGDFTPGYGVDDAHYDGASLWSGFEEAQIKILDGLGFPHPPIVAGGRSGQSAARLAEGVNNSPPLYFLAGYKHRFSAWLKADADTVVKVGIDGNFDGKPYSTAGQFNVSHEWTLVTLEAAPPQTLRGEMHAVVEVPHGVSVLMDDAALKLSWRNR